MKFEVKTRREDAMLPSGKIGVEIKQSLVEAELFSEAEMKVLKEREKGAKVISMKIVKYDELLNVEEFDDGVTNELYKVVITLDYGDSKKLRHTILMAAENTKCINDKIKATGFSTDYVINSITKMNYSELIDIKK